MNRKARLFAAIMALACIVTMAAEVNTTASAEGTEQNAWILRRECDNVLIQKQPGRQPYQYWRFVDNDPPVGAELQLTGKQTDQWMECRCLYLPNAPTGWIHEGFVVYDKPTKVHKTATITQDCRTKVSIGGRTAWEYYRGEPVEIYTKTERWCTCSMGFIQTEAITFSDDVEVIQRSSEARKAKFGYGRDWIKRDHIIHPIDTWN